ncbi:hypothetical protein OHB26_07595 [Nocardia sp. NBC_01503]|uniref:hypothetical protein n=1 Tax=Nocardia sp. NBC_01503 TaxID=2975997 RepID=UPI002E7B0444|nr:hypothetical protein [Nocardia sp. NBC_01503]WTL34069.1 hypothetical protein OHB26_07595 [Nocardia sp. NBC_01503]
MTEAVGTGAAPTAAGRSAEFWGYLMWGLAGLAIAVPELASVFRLAGWPTISATIGHLQAEHSGVRLVVVFVIVVAAYYAVPQLLINPKPVARTVGGRPVTANGRATTDIGSVDLLGVGYLVFAFAALVLGVLFAAGARRMSPDSYLGAYVLYGVIGLAWVLIPSVLSLVFSKDVPFPTLFRTIGYLERRAHPVAAVLLALLVVLLLHLALYPWPRVVS